MVIFIFFLKTKSYSNIGPTPKRTKLHHFKNISRGMSPNFSSNAHGFATCKLPNLKKIIPPPCQILATPLFSYMLQCWCYALY